MRISDWSSDVCSSDLQDISMAVGTISDGKLHVGEAYTREILLAQDFQRMDCLALGHCRRSHSQEQQSFRVAHPLYNANIETANSTMILHVQHTARTPHATQRRQPTQANLQSSHQMLRYHVQRDTDGRELRQVVQEK